MRILNAMNGDTLLPSYLDEWTWCHKRDRDHYFHDLLEAITENLE